MIEVPAHVWLLFGGTLLVMLAIDLLAHRGERSESRKASVVWSIV